MDLGYFDFPFKAAEIGKPQVTHWEWKLDYYGLDKSNLDWINLNNLRNIPCKGFAILSEVKKKPANIINRLF